MSRRSKGSRIPAAELLADLKDPKARAAVEAQLEPVGHRDVQPANALPAPAAKRDPYRSKAERDYAAWLHGISGIVWRYERHPIRLPGAGTRYLADFSLRCREGTEGADVHSNIIPIVGPDGRGPRLPCFARACLVDVKGTKDGKPYWPEGARRRALDGAAEWWETLGIRLFVAWRVDGVWQHERIPTRPA